MSNWDVFITRHPLGNCGAIHVKHLPTGEVDVFDNAIAYHENGISFVPPEGVSWGADALQAIVDAIRAIEDV